MLLTIGEFGHASGLSPKALRLYDELGLLPPARVDPLTGYRFYDPAQLERAGLVAWLRRLGMPLARIRVVCDLPPGAAAEAVAAFWEQVESDTDARRDLATFLVDHLSRKDTAMNRTGAPLAIRYAALTDTGLIRESNQDAAYAGARLLAVADGFGAGGAPASAAAIDALRRLDTAEETGAGTTSPGVPAGGLLNALENAVQRANLAVRGLADTDPSLQGLGTTLTAMVWSGSQLALVHIGDSRAYLLRDGELFQITHDHTLVQSMVDDGRISPGEAASHPQRTLLLRALDGGAAATADLRLHDALPGDRYLLCSDGLTAAVPGPDIHRVLAAVADPDGAVRELIALANAAGGPDNVSCAVADVVEPVVEPAVDPGVEPGR